MQNKNVKQMLGQSMKWIDALSFLRKLKETSRQQQSNEAVSKKSKTNIVAFAFALKVQSAFVLTLEAAEYIAT